MNSENILDQKIKKNNQDAQARAILNMPPEELEALIVRENIDMGEEKSVAGRKELVARALMGNEAYEKIYKPMRSNDAARKMKQAIEES